MGLTQTSHHSQRPNNPQSTLVVDCFSLSWSFSDTYHQHVDYCLEPCNSSSTTVPKILKFYSTHEICTCGLNISADCSQQCFLAGLQQRPLLVMVPVRTSRH